ncbi:MAG: hypothetical protein AAFN30_12975 [Actinomycetota bacterium]
MENSYPRVRPGRVSTNGARRRTRRTRAVAVLFAAALALAACGGDDGAGDAPLAAGSASVLPAETFDGTAQTLEGEAFDLGQLAGTDLILWFWAPW